MRINIDTPTKTIDSRLFFAQTGFRLYLENNLYWLDGDTNEKTLLEAYANHNPENLAEKKQMAKAAVLAKLGLTADEVAALLG
jgi:hypothetical protein